MQSEAINELAAALAKAQGEITGALKDSENSFYKSKYADLAACWDACRKQLAANGLTVIQTTDTDGPEVILLTTLAHQSGQWIRGRLPVKCKDDTPQAQGSALTYARRYALAAIVGLAQIDDDAESAQGRKHSPLGDAPELTDREKADIESFVSSFTDALNADVDESEMAENIARLAAEVKERQHIYVEVWRRLDSKQRSAIKKFLAKADKRK